MVQEYKDFISKGNIVTIAVGLVMALYFQKIIDAFLDGVINPVIAAIFGESNFTHIGFDLGEARVSIGLVIDAAISFVLVATVLFLIVRAYNKMQAEQEEADPGPDEKELLTQIRDALVNR